MNHEDITAALEPREAPADEIEAMATPMADPAPDASQGDSEPSSPVEEIIVFDNCPCGKEAELILVAERQARCVACLFDERMTRPCFQCKKHVVEAMVRAIGVNGQKDFVGVCIKCLNAHVSTQNN